MHFVVGGAFQGKRKWVVEHYRLTEVAHVWCSGYTQAAVLPGEVHAHMVVFEGLEAWIRRLPERAYWESFFQAWYEWERGADGRYVIWIGCDITQGIVPLEKEERQWRDVTGWCYQQLAKQCTRVDRIWCGLAERMK